MSIRRTIRDMALSRAKRRSSRVPPNQSHTARPRMAFHLPLGTRASCGFQQVLFLRAPQARVRRTVFFRVSGSRNHHKMGWLSSLTKTYKDCRRFGSYPSAMSSASMPTSV